MPPKAAPKKNLSALKRDRQAEKKNETNRSAKTKIKNIKLKVLNAVNAGDKDAAVKAVKEAEKIISMVASKGIIKKNTASRNVSRLAKKVNKVVKAS